MSDETSAPQPVIVSKKKLSIMIVVYLVWATFLITLAVLRQLGH
jgi:hypothetical protein